MIRLDALEPDARRVVDLARDTARSTGIRAALVGGAVRDLILGEPVFDLDFVAEGDAEAFARELAVRLDAPLHHHERFQTWRMDVPELEPVDVVTARTETYGSPGSLPQVRPATIEEDLLRRDFPINCIALELASGAILDPASGVNDLREKRLRILHERSFEDDPTRLFRLFRLAERYGLLIEAQTLRLARAAIEQEMIRNVSFERIRRELDLAFDEPQAPEVLCRFADEDLLDTLFGEVSCESSALGAGRTAARELGAPASDVLLALLTGEKSADTVARLWGAASARRVARIRTEAEWLRRILLRTSNPLRLTAAASRVLDSSIACVADAAGREKLIEARRRWKTTTLRGDVLGNLNLPGAALGLVLRKARIAVACGLVPPSEAAEFALARGVQYLEPRRLSS